MIIHSSLDGPNEKWSNPGKKWFGQLEGGYEKEDKKEHTQLINLILTDARRHVGISHSSHQTFFCSWNMAQHQSCSTILVYSFLIDMDAQSRETTYVLTWWFVSIYLVCWLIYLPQITLEVRAFHRVSSSFITVISLVFSSATRSIEIGLTMKISILLCSYSNVISLLWKSAWRNKGDRPDHLYWWALSPRAVTEVGAHTSGCSFIKSLLIR